MKIILLRHGLTEANKNMTFSRPDTRISKDGLGDLDRARDFLKERSFSKVYTSALIRSQETAKYLGFTNFTIDERLNELDFGDFKGLPLAETREKFPEVYQGLEKDKINYRYPNGESLMDLYLRIGDFLDEKVKEGEDILCFSHGIAIRTSLARVLGDFSLLDKFWLENGSLTVYSIVDGKKMIESVNLK